MHSASPVLPFGAFYGQVEHRRRAPGLDVAVLDVDPHRVVERHSHEEAHFVLVLDGLYVSSAAGADAVSCAPFLVFNPAGTTHRDRFEARSRVMEGRFLTLSFSADMIAAAAGDGAALHHTATAIHDPHAVALAKRVARECVSTSGLSDLGTESLGASLLSLVAKTRGVESSHAPRWLRVAEELLHDASDQNLRIAHLAAAVGVHPVHFARVFRQFVGCTPADYLRRRRIERSMVLLRETNRPLSEIAACCGFGDQSHFSNAFRRVHGVTPGRCRGARSRGQRS
jgi:AraC family transcriptional regulator